MARKTKKKEELTVNSLTLALWETLNGIKDGTVKPVEANSIAAQSREICRIKKLQLDAAKLMGKPSDKDLRKLSL